MRPTPFLFLALLSSLAAAPDKPVAPPPGFEANRYETLWTHSPFALAAPDAAAASQDYQLVGLAQFDGVYYASLIVKQTQEHFVLSSDKPVNNLQLVSVTHDDNGGSAIIQRGSERLVLQEEKASAAASAPLSAVAPGGTTSEAGIAPGAAPDPRIALRRARMHRPLIVVPPPPAISN